MGVKLPIDVVPGTNPPKFTWSQVVEDLSGGRNLIDYTGVLPPAVEKAVADLIALAKHLIKENAALSKRVEAPKKGK